MIIDSRLGVKLIIILISVFVISMILQFFLAKKFYNRQVELTRDIEIHGVIQEINIHYSAAIIKLDSLEYLIDGADNFNYSKPFLNSFLRVGDSISKETECDTLNVYRRKKKYFFILGKTINQD